MQVKNIYQSKGADIFDDAQWCSALVHKGKKRTFDKTCFLTLFNAFSEEIFRDALNLLNNRSQYIELKGIFQVTKDHIMTS